MSQLQFCDLVVHLSAHCRGGGARCSHRGRSQPSMMGTATGLARGARRWTRRADEGAGRVDDVWADDGAGVEEDGPAEPCWGGNWSGGGHADDVAPGRKPGRRRSGGGYRSRGGWAGDAALGRKPERRRSGGGYRRREQSDGGGWAQAGGRVGVVAATTDLAGRAVLGKGERVCGHTQDRARACGG
jgi:hypothetical protein